MDYNYLELERQIRALQNMVHVPSSGVSKTTEELRNGNNSFVVDTIQHYFMFKYGGINEPLSVDPITKSILNVKFINDVDVSKLLGGIREGYGINIESIGGGVYKINVIENMFALKSDVDELEDMITEIDNTTYTKTECDDRYVKLNGNSIIRGSLTLSNSLTHIYINPMGPITYQSYNGDTKNNEMRFGKSSTYCCRLAYKETEEDFDCQFQLIHDNFVYNNITLYQDRTTFNRYIIAPKIELKSGTKTITIDPSISEFFSDYNSSLISEYMSIGKDVNNRLALGYTTDGHSFIVHRVDNIIYNALRLYNDRTEIPTKLIVNNVTRKITIDPTKSEIFSSYYNSAISEWISIGKDTDDRIALGCNTGKFAWVNFRINGSIVNQIDMYNDRTQFTNNIVAPNITTIENRITALENKPTSNIDAYTKSECDDKFVSKNVITYESINVQITPLGPTFKGSLNDTVYRIIGNVSGNNFEYNGVLNEQMILYDNNVVNVSCENGIIMIYDGLMDITSVERVIIKNNNNFALQDQTYTKNECDDKFVSSNDLHNITHENENMIGKLCIAHADSQDEFKISQLEQAHMQNGILDSLSNVCIDGYTAKLSSFNAYNGDSITFNVAYYGIEIEYEGNTYSSTVNGNKLEFVLDGSTYSTSNTTITHYAPIEGDITFKIGSPVFFSGKVYKQNNEKWELSTTSDRTDCICSVINVGNHKTFAGVVVSIDESKNSLTFASHGDFMFNVEDTNLYEVGDVILYDGRILEDDLTITSALLQSVVGKITAILDEHTLAIFKD